jgi:hypothetical protein
MLSPRFLTFATFFIVQCRIAIIFAASDESGNVSDEDGLFEDKDLRIDYHIFKKIVPQMTTWRSTIRA